MVTIPSHCLSPWLRYHLIVCHHGYNTKCLLCKIVTALQNRWCQRFYCIVLVLTAFSIIISWIPLHNILPLIVLLFETAGLIICFTGCTPLPMITTLYFIFKHTAHVYKLVNFDYFQNDTVFGLPT